MSDGGLVVSWFSLSLLGSVFVIWASIRAAKRRVPRWDSNFYTWFIISIGGFGQRQIENWKRWGHFDEDQAEIIIKYQLMCWFGVVLWSLASMAVVMGYKALTYEDGEPQAIEISVDRAVLTDSATGKPAMTVYLNSNSARKFEIFTAKGLGHSIEVKFHDVLVVKAILRTPIGGGHFEVGVLPDRIEGTLNEGNAVEVAQRLSAGDAKLEARVAD